MYSLLFWFVEFPNVDLMSVELVANSDVVADVGLLSVALPKENVESF